MADRYIVVRARTALSAKLEALGVASRLPDFDPDRAVEATEVVGKYDGLGPFYEVHVRGQEIPESELRAMDGNR